MKTLKFRILELNGMINVALLPVNEEAIYACKLVKREYITQEEALIFQKLGLQIEIEQAPLGEKL